MSTLLDDLTAFVAESGLSKHRAGIILANNGRLIDRLEEGGRIWPDTEQKIRDALAAERQARKLVSHPSPSAAAPSEREVG